MNIVSLILGGLGLSQREAADHLGVRVDTIKSWVGGRNKIPSGALVELHALAARQAAAADRIVEAYREAVDAAGGAPPESVDFSDLDDAGARAAGWPSAGAYRAVIRRAWEMISPHVRVELVAGEPTVGGARHLRQLTDADG